MSELQVEWIRRSGKVHAFTGVSAFFDNDGDQVCIVAASEEILFSMLREFMPQADLSQVKFQRVSIIQAKP
jgi:hypothetical protein